MFDAAMCKKVHRRAVWVVGFLPGDVPVVLDVDVEVVVDNSSDEEGVEYGLFVAATILIVLAAFDYLFSKGDPEKVKAGQNALIYAIVALIVGVLAGGIPKIVGGILGVQ